MVLGKMTWPLVDTVVVSRSDAGMTMFQKK
jgi:hypothetical protein